MNRNQISVSETGSNDESDLRNSIQTDQVFGLVSILMGLSQVVVGLSFIDPESLFTMSSWGGYLLGAGGWLLIGIGMNLFRGKEAFDDGWIESERITWLSTVVLLVFTVGVAAATVWVLFL